MKAPKFWNSGASSLVPQMLAPLSAVYQLANWLHRSRMKTETVSVPVICIGNVVAGGAGKTPVAIAIAQFLEKLGWVPHFLSRGYGGSLEGPERVVLDVHDASMVGDEPLLLAGVAPTWVAKDRLAGAKAAIAAGANVIVMDDGLQNPSIEKTISVLVIDGDFGVGNGRLMPAGPLREAPSSAVKKSDAIVVVGDTAIKLQFDTGNVPVFRARIVPHALQSELVGEKVVAFAGIGRPGKFFKSLELAGADIVAAVEFADHHPFSQNDIMKLVEKASLHNAALVTTRKDYVRLPIDAKMMTTVFDIDLLFEKPKTLQNLLIESLGNREHA